MTGRMGFLIMGQEQSAVETLEEDRPLVTVCRQDDAVLY